MLNINCLHFVRNVYFKLNVGLCILRKWALFSKFNVHVNSFIKIEICRKICRGILPYIDHTATATPVLKVGNKFLHN